MSETKTMATRKCSHCGKEITEGYVIDGGDEYYWTEFEDEPTILNQQKEK